VPSGLAAELLPKGTEVQVIRESLMWSGLTQFEQMKVWRMMNYLLGVPAAVLAAIAGGTGLAATKSCVKLSRVLSTNDKGFPLIDDCPPRDHSAVALASLVHSYPASNDSWVGLPSSSRKKVG
jgi:hypothetical protein